MKLLSKHNNLKTILKLIGFYLAAFVVYLVVFVFLGMVLKLAGVSADDPQVASQIVSQIMPITDVLYCGIVGLLLIFLRGLKKTYIAYGLVLASIVGAIFFTFLVGLVPLAFLFTFVESENKRK